MLRALQATLQRLQVVLELQLTLALQATLALRSTLLLQTTLALQATLLLRSTLALRALQATLQRLQALRDATLQRLQALQNATLQRLQAAAMLQRLQLLQAALQALLVLQSTLQTLLVLQSTRNHSEIAYHPRGATHPQGGMDRVFDLDAAGGVFGMMITLSSVHCVSCVLHPSGVASSIVSR